MKRDQAVTHLLRRAGQREGDSTLETQVIEEMQLIQESYEQMGVPTPRGGTFWPGFLLKEVTTAQTTQGDARMQLPNDFLQEYEGSGLFAYNTDGDEEWTPLAKVEWTDLRREFASTSDDQDTPKYYSLVGQYFYLFPVPDASYDIKMIYYGQDSVLSSNIENEWLKHAPWLLIAATGEAMASNLRDDALLELFSRRRQEAAQQLWIAQSQLEQANRQNVMGSARWGPASYIH